MQKFRRHALKIFVVLAVMTPIAAFWWYRSHKSVGLRDAFNPVYWVRRSRGEDLYDSKDSILFHGNHNLKEIALTIDDGPHDPTGGLLLDILKAEKVHATFFVVGKGMSEYPHLIQRMVGEGHEVANHTHNHYRLPTLQPDHARREVNDNDINFFKITGRHMNLMRPPGVQYNPQVVEIIQRLGYQIIHVNVTARDFEDVSPEFIYRRVISRTENGSIILLHDDRMSTVVALPRILRELKRQGYKFVTVSEMLHNLPHPIDVPSNPGAVSQ